MLKLLWIEEKKKDTAPVDFFKGRLWDISFFHISFYFLKGEVKMNYTFQFAREKI